MKEGQRLWTRDELILAINLYWKLPFGKMHRNTAEVIALSKLIPRTPSAIARKLGNFASFDPSLKARGVGGLPNSSKLDEEIWNEFYENVDELAYESEVLRAKYENLPLEPIATAFEEKEGKERIASVKVRVNQSFFRSTILASYDYTCCITGISISSLLVAAHITKWSDDEKNRMNPHNRLCLNAFHDRAYENGLISIAPDYTIKVSTEILKSSREEDKKWLEPFHNLKIRQPGKFLPDSDLLERHYKSRFNG